MTQTSSCLNTNQTICNGTFRYDNAYHTQYECSTQIYSSFELPSCYNGDPTMSVYWFWYDDVCKFNDTIDTIFAVVPIDGTRVCQDSPKLHITYESCERDYDFQRETMTIKNITNLTQQKYICFLSTNRVPMNFTSGRIYSINVLEPTTSVTTSSSTTSVTSTSTGGNIGSSTITESNPSDDSLVLKIVLPVVLGVVAIAVIILVGFLCYRRGRKNERSINRPVRYRSEERPSREEPSSRRNSSPIDQRREIYGEDISTEENDNDTGIWHLV